MFSTTPIPPCGPAQVASEQAHPSAQQPQRSSFVTGGPLPATTIATAITERNVRHDGSPSKIEAQASAVMIDQNDIRSDWRGRFSQAYWIEAAEPLKLSSSQFATLEQDGYISLSLMEQAENTDSHLHRSMLVLNLIHEGADRQMLAYVLNLLNQSRGEVPSHGVLFDRIVADPKMMVTPVQSKQPTVVPESEVAPTPQWITEEDIDDNWRQRFASHYPAKLAEHLDLNLVRLAMLERSEIISTSVRQRAEKDSPGQERSMRIFGHIVGGGAPEDLANFLNFLQQTQKTVASHGKLLGMMVFDPQIVDTPGYE